MTRTGDLSLPVVWQALKQRLRAFIGDIPPAPETLAPPPLAGDPMEALLLMQAGESAAFLCPIDQSTHFVGFGFSTSGWHPFVAALVEYRLGLAASYDASILKDYYEAWRPDTAAAALAGFELRGSALSDMPPHCFYVTPWSATTPELMTELVIWWSACENEEHGDSSLDFRDHGLGYFGPTHPAKGELEYRRLTTIFERLRATGYDRSHGDVNVRLLARGAELRFIVDGGGYHRTAAMSAAGMQQVPAVFREPFAIRVEDVDYWPQVRRGVWNRDDAVRYFHHLFDFDSRGWARERGLLLEQKYPDLRPGEVAIGHG
jgi:hypothetical protein